MEIISEIFNHLITAGLIGFGTGVLYKRKLIVRQARCYYYRRSKCRISFGCILKIKHRNKYLLIKNFNRPEALGPIGGVFKYYKTAAPFLESINFIPQHPNKPRAKNDLRGFIPIDNLNKLIKWFYAGLDRESESISREFREELTKDIHLVNSAIIKKSTLQIKYLRTIAEGPYNVSEQAYVQYRQLHLYELVDSDKYSREIINFLVKESQINDNIEWVTAEEIKLQRLNDDSSKIIGSYCGYLIGKSRIRGEDIPYK